MTKNKFNPDIHHRSSIRLKDYDYSKAGAYFVTVCNQGREPLLGEVMDGEMILNDAGRMVEQWWMELNNKFPDMETDTFMIMPNHFHGIIMIAGTCLVPARNDIVGAALCGRPGFTDGQPHRVAPTLGTIMDWFKTMTTNEYIRGVKQSGWPSFPGKFWQRNYYEHVIRTEEELNRIREYIMYNPATWAEDENNPMNIK